MKTKTFILLGVLFFACCSSKKEETKTQSDNQKKTFQLIIIRQSGGTITDIWLIKNSETNVNNIGASDLLSFTDQNGNLRTISGDYEVINVRENAQSMFHNYTEYHSEFDSLTYQQRLRKTINQGYDKRE